jgi:hypothetical protein
VAGSGLRGGVRERDLADVTTDAVAEAATEAVVELAADALAGTRMGIGGVLLRSLALLAYATGSKVGACTGGVLLRSLALLAYATGSKVAAGVWLLWFDRCPTEAEAAECAEGRDRGGSGDEGAGKPE